MGDDSSGVLRECPLATSSRREFMRQKRFGTSHVHHTRIENAPWRSCWDWLPERFRKSRSFKRKCHAETQAKTPLAAGEGGRPCSCLNVLTGMRRRRFSRAGGGDAGEPDPLLARCVGGVPGVRRCELDVQPADGDVPPVHRGIPPGAGASVQRAAEARVRRRRGGREHRRRASRAGQDAAASQPAESEVQTEGAAGAEEMSLEG